MRKKYNYEINQKTRRHMLTCYHCKKPLTYENTEMVEVKGVGLVPYCRSCKRLFVDQKPSTITKYIDERIKRWL